MPKISKAARCVHMGKTLIDERSSDDAGGAGSQAATLTSSLEARQPTVPLRGRACARPLLPSRTGHRDLDRAYVACRYCSLFDLCLPVGIGEADLELLERIIKRRRLLRRGESLFRPGDPFEALYAVKSGSLRTCALLDDGTVQVIGFHLPGELLGLDAIAGGSHRCEATALETASLCEVPFDRLEELGAAIPSVQRQLLRILSRQVFHDQNLALLHGKRSAEARLAAFLMSLGARLSRRGFSGLEFRLSMSRADIGSYLGMAKETVCRILAEFEAQGLLVASWKTLRIQKPGRLESIAGRSLSDA